MAQNPTSFLQSHIRDIYCFCGASQGGRLDTNRDRPASRVTRPDEATRRGAGPMMTHATIAGEAGTTAANPFERIVALWRENEVLLSELESIQERLRDARIYRESSGGTALASAWIDRLQARKSAARALLRANRIETEGL